jgi:hypothetical protein
MNRRRFVLGLGAIVATPLLAPFFRRRASADASVPGVRGAVEQAFIDAVSRARTSSKRLVILTIPADDSAKWLRGTLLGELLNHGKDADLAPLADVELVAATLASVSKSFPSASGEPIFWVASPTGALSAFDLPKPLAPSPPTGRRGYSADEQRREEAVIDRRIAALGALVRVALGAAASTQVAELAALARARYVEKRIPGTHWGNASGCGSSVEEDVEPAIMPDCGMGHVPARSSRFLYLYAQTPGEQRRANAQKQKGTSL